ncbi:Uncharacterised protein [Zhongshania aliphaticivorans]|uniref:Glutaredoxin n=1 Tax=Zhongshania aliphaticivorans TaxID=1470434 RepID=A0A5S9QFU9_9GAMM|nr:glutaredoxin family protein [Zhongshania aliphaticivorans]CAA0088259.1 Uncharacterised protein [Zhongshania aliphaticivorans]CAA0116229.1 Uncharacterised protein [Zhongshania aliphaticivorans]CAA0120392.1 Uncharacterised protein [Zhongshania aliphaticivorans]
MKEFRLYGTSACHLCELAEAILAQLLVEQTHWQIELIDIADDDATLEKYADTIPLLKRFDGNVLCWPFDTSSVMQFAEET